MTLMNLEDIMLSELSQTEKDKYHLHVKSKKKKKIQMNKQNKTESFMF